MKKNLRKLFIFQKSSFPWAMRKRREFQEEEDDDEKSA
jgi:hypothetical protein